MSKDKNIHQYLDELKEYAKESGYFLNPDPDFLFELAKGLYENEQRYGYPACPCRLSKGDREKDLDIICPCDYRDPDLSEFGTCYCALYVDEETAKGNKDFEPIPDRRKSEKSKTKTIVSPAFSKSTYPIWRCKVCGYLCAREAPPEKCPICKVSKDRFEQLG